jgi:hypothetical protein
MAHATWQFADMGKVTLSLSISYILMLKNALYQLRINNYELRMPRREATLQPCNLTTFNFFHIYLC